MLNRFAQFSYMISSIYRNIQKIEHDEMVKLGYKGAYAKYLVAMFQQPQRITSSNLCELCDKNKAAVSRMISEMEEKGLVKKMTIGHSECRLFPLKTAIDYTMVYLTKKYKG